MKFDPQKHHRRSIRLPKYDYCVGGFVPPTRYAAGTKPAARQPGGYFITIVTYHRDLLFGEIVNEEMQLNDYGKITQECWRAIPDHFPNVELGAYMVMPNHIHGIIIIKDNMPTINPPLTVGARHVSPLPQPSNPHGFKRGSIGAIVGSFKAAVSKRLAREHNATGIWQRNYYEHVIRNRKDWDRIHKYIESNPSLWVEDEENPMKHM